MMSNPLASAPTAKTNSPLAKKVTIVGGGVIGVTTAFFMQQAGFEVRLLEATDKIAAATSKANGGQLSVSHAEPWATPDLPGQLPKLLSSKHAPLKIKLTLDPHQYRWLLSFLRECLPARHLKNTLKLTRLGLESRAALAQIHKVLAHHKVDLTYARRDQGILHFYTHLDALASAQKPSKIKRAAGLAHRWVTSEEAKALEPALSSVKGLLRASFTPSDSSGDARLFSLKLSRFVLQQGAKIRLGAKVNRLKTDTSTNQITSLLLDSGETINLRDGEILVLCTGVHTPKLTRPLGIYPQIYPAKGYSATYDVLDPSRVPEISLIDDEYKLVYSRFTEAGLGGDFGSGRDVLRVAGMAEIGGYDLTLDPLRANLITERVSALFGDAVNLETPNYWCGLRPSTPSNLPYVCRTPVSNLWLNAGHGTLGWTQAAGSAKRLSDLITASIY